MTHAVRLPRPDRDTAACQPWPGYIGHDRRYWLPVACVNPAPGHRCQPQKVSR